MNRKQLLEKIGTVLKKHGATKIALFGSYARGEQRPTSDVDILVEFGDRKSLLDLVGIEQEVSEAIGKKVDLLTEGAISPLILPHIKRDLEVIA